MSSFKEELEVLTDQQDLFCREYLKDVNISQAAIRAGYSYENPNRGYQLMKKPAIRKRIQELMNKRNKTLEVDSNFVLKQLINLANSDIGKAFKPNGELKSLDAMPQSLRKAIASVEVDELWEGYGKEREQIGVTKKIRFWDKPKALELIGRHLKMFNDKIEHDIGPTLADLILQSMKLPPKAVEALPEPDDEDMDDIIG